jgi:hypothetical protein
MALASRLNRVSYDIMVLSLLWREREWALSADHVEGLVMSLPLIHLLLRCLQPIRGHKASIAD